MPVGVEQFDFEVEPEARGLLDRQIDPEQLGAAVEGVPEERQIDGDGVLARAREEGDVANGRAHGGLVRSDGGVVPAEAHTHGTEPARIVDTGTQRDVVAHLGPRHLDRQAGHRHVDDPDVEPLERGREGAVRHGDHEAVVAEARRGPEQQSPLQRQARRQRPLTEAKLVRTQAPDGDDGLAVRLAEDGVGQGGGGDPERIAGQRGFAGTARQDGPEAQRPEEAADPKRGRCMVASHEFAPSYPPKARDRRRRRPGVAMITVPLPDHVRLTRSFHVALAARKRYDVRDSIVDLRGRVLVADPATAERLAARINEVRHARTVPGVAVSGAEIVAAALLDEAIHLVLDAYRRTRDAGWTAKLDAHLTERLGAQRVTAARRAFVAAFPPNAVMRGDADVASWLNGRVDDLPAREVALEERIAVRLANENPALERMRELVDDSTLGDDDAAAAQLLERRLSDLPGLAGTTEDDLWALLRAPMRASPTSLEGQLAFVREHWGAHLGDDFRALLARLERSLDLLAELRAGGPPGPPGPAPVLDRAALARGRDEPEAYSPDADWMPSVVLVAKNAYVWMDQLSRWTGREIRTLDQIPDEALAELRANGFSGLWLIGLWQRSEASARIKRMRGQEDAVASAYSLDDYRIADDLGGYDAWRALRDRAGRHGLRLAADMVPNHVGIDGRWVIERPDYFLDLPTPPYPGYSFHGPDLSSDDRVEIRIEDGYWESRDAAVVFERLDRASGERRYVYHGNDGTSMPWNDTAQIDYLNPVAREAVIQVILEVARMFPIIRFDAAMTLAKQHVQRLWYPPPGHGGAIPSRSAYGSMSDEEFDRRMPVEFWREVVDRVAVEAPDTLLLAEAFWMMEGYFVRTLGMHRVYNSAFMNMLAREANEDYQSLMRNVLSFDPQILARFVNFMNNPDEETAIAQFGDGDKAFGVATLMATLPGLPMFGHGQVEGLHEKYGMEYRSAKVDERPNEHMVARHRAEVAPLLARRHEFAGTDRFRLFEVDGDHGPLHDVFAYANGLPGGAMNLVLYHNRYAEASGRIRRTVPFAQGGGTGSVGVVDALGLRGGHDRYVRFRDLTTGREHIARSDEWREAGIPVQLGAYQRRILVDMMEVRDVDGRWARLHQRFGAEGVPNLEEALRDLELEAVHRAFSRVVRADDERGPDDGSRGAFGPDGRSSEVETEIDGDTRSEADDESETEPEAGPEPVATNATDATDATDAAADGPAGTADERPVVERLHAFAAAVRDEADDLRFDIGRAVQRLDTARGATAVTVPGLAWRRAFAVACGFDRPRTAAHRLRLEPLVAREHVPPDPRYVPADAWAALWTALLPATSEATASGPSSASGSTSSTRTPSGVAPRSTTGPSGADPAEPPSAPDGADGETSSVAATVGEALRALEADPRMLRIVGVHEHDGVRWFRQEGFHAWREAWLAARAIVAPGEPTSTMADLRAALDRREAASGYRFDRLVQAERAERADAADASRDADTEAEASDAGSTD